VNVYTCNNIKVLEKHKIRGLDENGKLPSNYGETEWTHWRGLFEFLIYSGRTNKYTSGWNSIGPTFACFSLNI
jgi:hypothetical protein